MCYSTNTPGWARLNACVSETSKGGNATGERSQQGGSVTGDPSASLCISSTREAEPEGIHSQRLRKSAVGESTEPNAPCEGGTNSGTMTAAATPVEECLQPAAGISRVAIQPITPQNSADGRTFDEIPQMLAPLPSAPTIDISHGTDCTCLLLHIHHSGIPSILRKLLESSSICKAGLNISGDSQKLKTDFGIELGGMVELSDLANQRCLAQVDLVMTHTETRRWSLSGAH